MSISDPFLPAQGDDEFRRDAPLEHEDHDSEDESEPDVFPGASDDSDQEQPVDRDAVFRTPTGDAVNPADD
jgi:hypothetical protein